MSLEASLLALLIAAVLLLSRLRIPPKWRYALWCLVLAKLILPVSFSSPLSLYNLLPTTTGSPHVSLSATTPTAGLHASLPPAARAPKPGPSGPDPSLTLAPTSKALTPAPAPFPYLTILYLAGTLTLAILVITQSLRLALALRPHRPLTDQTTLDLLEDAKQQMRIHTHLPLIETDRVATPALFGFIRPKLLLPPGRVLHSQAQALPCLGPALSPNHLRHVFLHELAHLKRLDVPLNCLATLLLILHWFNPILWLVLWRRAERELACDAMVLGPLARDHEPPQSYAHTLLDLLAAPAPTPPMANLACVLENPRQLRHRIAMIAHFRPTPWQTTLTATSLLLLLTLVGLTQANPHNDHPPKSNPAATQSPPTPPLSPGMAMPGSPQSAPNTSPSPTTQPATRAIGNVYITGSLKRPGAYALPPDADLTLRNLLAAAGEPELNTDPWIYLYRIQDQNSLKQILAAPYTQAIAAPNNPTLMPGDLIFITQKPITPVTYAPAPSDSPKVYLEGAGHRSGTYALPEDQSLTLLRLLAAADFDPSAHLNDRVLLIRRLADKSEQTFDLRINDILAGDTPDISLLPNDMVSVLPHAPGVAILVTPSPDSSNPHAPNILSNPGHEDGSDAPDLWSQAQPFRGVQYLWDRHAGFNSNASLCLHKTANRISPSPNGAKRFNGQEPHRTSKSAQVKAQNATKAILDVLFLDENDQWIRHESVAYIGSQKDGDPPANHDWKPYTGQVDIPPNAKKIQIGLQIYGPGKVWFDDITATYVQ